MTKQNKFLQEQRNLRVRCMEVASDTTEQQMFDYLCIVLNDPEIMGKNVFGASRLKKIHAELMKVHEQFKEAWESNEEADYKQEKFDERLKAIFGEECPPFRERYPYIEECRYDRPYKRRKR